MADTLVRFLHISDTHLNPDMAYRDTYAVYHPMVGMNALIKIINDLPFKPDFILHTGDVAWNPVPEDYEHVKQVMARIPYPVYYVVGNHDHAPTLQKVLMGRAETDIQPFLHYEFEVKGVQFAVLDSNGPAELPAGNVTPEQVEWLDKICSAQDDRPLVIATHHNVVVGGVPWLDNWMRTTNGEELHQIIVKARHRLRGVFHGHIHQATDILRDGVLYSSAASVWQQFTGYPTPDDLKITPDPETLPGYSIVTLTRDQTYIRRYTFRF